MSIIFNLHPLVAENLFRMAEAGKGECEGRKIVKTEERKLSQADFEALTRYPNTQYFIIRTMLVDGNINTLLLFFFYIF